MVVGHTGNRFGFIIRNGNSYRNGYFDICNQKKHHLNFSFPQYTISSVGRAPALHAG